MKKKERIRRALEIARSGMVDGAHHKAWIIDQMVRALTGCEESEPESAEYWIWVANTKAGGDGPDTYQWDEGIPP